MGLTDKYGRARWADVLIVLALAFALWRSDFMFFWRDDWDFLDSLRSAGPAWLFEDHYGHVLPLFKLMYWGEMAVMGTNTQWHGYVSVLLVGLGSVALLRLLQRVTGTVPAWTAVVLYTAHPLMFQHVGWIFEQSMSAHLLFQAMAVLQFLRWRESMRAKDLGWVLVCLIVQGLFFGNGHFLPLALAAGVWLWRDGKRPWYDALRGAWPFLAFFAGLIAMQLGANSARVSNGLAWQAVPGMLQGGAYLFGVNASRVLFLREGALGAATPWLASAVFLAVISLAMLRRDRDRRLAWLYLLWFGAVFCSVPLMRGGTLVGAEVPHYYTVLSLAPLLLLAEHALGGHRLWDRFPRPALLAGGAALVVGILVIDGELRRLVSFRHFRNEQLMNKSIIDGTTYYGLDDPYFTPERYRVDDARGIYLYWRARNRFGPVVGYEKDIDNWTREATIVGKD